MASPAGPVVLDPTVTLPPRLTPAPAPSLSSWFAPFGQPRFRFDTPLPRAVDTPASPRILRAETEDEAVPVAPKQDADSVAPPAATPHRVELSATVPPLDLASLEAGIRQFIDGLEAAGLGSGDLGSRWSLLPWLTAAVAAVAACEIARRQLKQPARRPDDVFSSTVAP